VEDNLVIIVVLNLNKKEDILICLESVSSLIYSPFKIVVVDNGSTDGSVEAIKSKFPQIHLIESKINLGVAGGRNLGIKYVNEKFNYKFILFLDNDIVIEKCALSKMVQSFDLNKNIGISTPKCLMMNSPGIIAYAGGMSINLFTGIVADIGNGEKDEGQFEQPNFIGACGGLSLISKNVINDIGIFDERFNPYGWEDVDFSIRARKKGFKIIYNPKAIVYHKGGIKGRGKAISEYEFSKAKSYFYLIRKHTNIFQILTICFILPLRVSIIIIKEIFKGDFKILLAQIRGFLSLFK
jgi:GT2 family glycosyltransferase